MTRTLVLFLAASLLLVVPACGGGGIDSRNKDLDRPKAPDEKPVDLPKK